MPQARTFPETVLRHQGVTLATAIASPKGKDWIFGLTNGSDDEAVRLPFIVADPSGRFTGDTDIVRDQLTSSVDFLPLIVSLGYNGSQQWMKGDLAQLYKGRHDMLPMLRSARAPGRQYLPFATDETISSYYNFLDAANHIVGIRTKDGKLGVYANWQNGTTNIVFDNTLELEFYDYSTPGGVAETDNRPNDPHESRYQRKPLRNRRRRGLDHFAGRQAPGHNSHPRASCQRRIRRSGPQDTLYRGADEHL